MDISEVTGLPELPEGYFWRVVSAHNIHDGTFLGVRLLLMQRWKGWFRTHESELRSTDHAIDGTAEEVREGLKRNAKTMHDWFVRSGEVIKMLGDYPPNNINN